MAKIIGLPLLSPTMEEGTLVRWAKREGEAVEVDDLLAEIDTDKATMEFRSFDKGVLLKILASEGQTLAPDAPVAILGEQGEDISQLLEEIRNRDGSPKKPTEKVVVERVEGEGEPHPKTPPDEVAAASSAGPADGAVRRVLASPLVRRLVRERNMNPADLVGSGPGGRIIKRDLDAYLERGDARATPVVHRSAGDRPPPRIEPASPMRRTIARRLTQSTQSVPHYYLTIDVDAEALLRARTAINEELAREDEKVSINDLIIKACASALRRMPAANVSWLDGDIHYHQVVDISVAVAIPDGLITPVVRDADQKGVLEISREVRELATRARARQLQPEEFTGGTFSVSNLGMFGIEDFTAIINPPEGAILAVGTIREEPVLRRGEVVSGQRMRVTLSCDHRVIDGATGAQWLAILKRMLEQPTTMLI